MVSSQSNIQQSELVYKLTVIIEEINNKTEQIALMYKVISSYSKRPHR